MTRENSLSILAIDDDGEYVGVLQSVLAGRSETRGATAASSSAVGAVTHSPTLSDGIEKLSESHPDVILVDIDLPDGNGLMTIEQVSSHRPAVPILALVEWGEYDKAFEAIDHGAADFLMKGMVVPEVIKRTIELTVDRHRRTNALAQSVETYEILLELLGDRLLSEAGAILGWGAELQARSDHEAIVTKIMEAGEDCVAISELATAATEAVSNASGPRQLIHLDEQLVRAIERVSSQTAGTVEVCWPGEERESLPVQGSDFVETALTEVLENALVHTDQQAPTAHVFVEIEDDTITVEVADEGVGMSIARSRMLSDPSQRYETPAGIGVGLFFATTVMVQIDGSFAIRPNDTGGMTATLTFKRH